MNNFTTLNYTSGVMLPCEIDLAPRNLSRGRPALFQMNLRNRSESRFKRQPQYPCLYLTKLI